MKNTEFTHWEVFLKTRGIFRKLRGGGGLKLKNIN